MPRSLPLSLSLSLNLLLIGIALVGWVAPNVPTTFNPHVAVPTIAASARIHPLHWIRDYRRVDFHRTGRFGPRR